MSSDAAKAMKMAEQEMEYRVELFNKMVSTCFEKCMSRSHKEGDLSVGEGACVDRCAAKYWQATGIIGSLLGSGGNGPPPGK